MLYTPLTKKALRIAFDAHKNQVDRSGLPYVFHPFHLAEGMEDEISAAAALLHDVAEDTPVTFEAMALQGIPPEVIEILKLLTHGEDVPYLDYVRKISESGNARAVKIKLADLNHNADLSRLDEVTAADYQRLEKHAAAKRLLEG